MDRRESPADPRGAPADPRGAPADGAGHGSREGASAAGSAGDPTGRFLAAVAAITVALVSLPYLYGWLHTPPGYRFAWVAPFSPADTNSYLAWVQQAARGRVLFQDLYTTEAHHVGLFLPFFLILGRAAAWTGLPVIVVYHASRLLLGVGVLLAGRWFARLFLPDPRATRTALALLAFSSGWGMLLVAISGRVVNTADVFAPEAVTFASFLSFPHFLAGTLLLTVALGMLWRALLSGSMRLAAGAGLLGALLALVHPFDMAVAWAVPIGCCLALRRRQAWVCLGVFVALSAPGMAYVLWAARADPVWQALSREVLVPPGPFWYVGGYGLLLAYAAAGALADARRRDASRMLPLIWWGVVTLLLYLPWHRQRGRTIEGLHVPLCVLAAYGVTVLEARFGSARRRVGLAWVLAGLTMAGSVVTVAWACGTYRAHRAPFYQPTGLVQVGAWLRANAPVATPVFATEISGNYLPAASGVRVFLGHYHQTVEYRQKQRLVDAFYSQAMPDAERRRLLARHGIRYVVYGPYESALGGFRPAAAPYLEEATAAGEGSLRVLLYRVR